MNTRTAALGLTATLVCTAGAVERATAEEVSAAKWDGVIQRIEDQRQAGNVPAAGVILFDAGKPVVIKGLGAATTQTPFRWGSITKTFTALAMLHLADANGWSLETPVAVLVEHPPFTNAWAATDPVRLIQLLELSAGFSDLSGAEFNFNEPLALVDALALNPASRETRWRPGLQHSYSNLIPGITSALIETLSGATFEDYLRQHVLLPLGMPGATLQPIANLPGGYKQDGTTPIPYWHMTFPAFGALNASLEEMANFMSALLHAGRVNDVQAIAPDSHRRMFQPHTGLAAQNGVRIGYGAGLYGRVRNGFVFFGHGGDADGYRSRYGLLPDAGRGYLVVINTDNPGLLRRMERILESALTENLPVPAAPVVADIDEARRAELTGAYYPSSARFGIERWRTGQAGQAEVKISDDGLVFTRGDRQTQLLPVIDNLYRRNNDPQATVVFVKHTDQRIYLQGELGNYVRVETQTFFDGTATNP